MRLRGSDRDDLNRIPRVLVLAPWKQRPRVLGVLDWTLRLWLHGRLLSADFSATHNAEGDALEVLKAADRTRVEAFFGLSTATDSMSSTLISHT